SQRWFEGPSGSAVWSRTGLLFEPSRSPPFDMFAPIAYVHPCKRNMPGDGARRCTSRDEPPRSLPYSSDLTLSRYRYREPRGCAPRAGLLNSEPDLTARTVRSRNSILEQESLPCGVAPLSGPYN